MWACRSPETSSVSLLRSAGWRARCSAMHQFTGIGAVRRQRAETVDEPSPASLAGYEGVPVGLAGRVREALDQWPAAEDRGKALRAGRRRLWARTLRGIRR